MKRRGICHCCKREVAYRFAHNNRKARMPHKCPHGQDCAAGVMPNAMHVNHPKCGHCADARRAERGEPPLVQRFARQRGGSLVKGSTMKDEMASGEYVRTELKDQIDRAKALAAKFVREAQQNGEDDFALLLAAHSMRKVFRKRVRLGYEVEPRELTITLDHCTREVEEEIHHAIMDDPRLAVPEGKES